MSPLPTGYIPSVTISVLLFEVISGWPQFEGENPDLLGRYSIVIASDPSALIKPRALPALYTISVSGNSFGARVLGGKTKLKKL